MTGGHWFDSGPGPVMLDHPEDREGPDRAESPAERAWREYSTHRARCTRCMTARPRCFTGDAFWAAFLESRGLSPTPEPPSPTSGAPSVP